MQTDLFELLLRFDTVLVPTGLHFGTKNGPKSEPKAIKKEVHMLIDFLKFFGRFLDHFDLHVGVSFWVPGLQKPSWGRLGGSWGRLGGSWGVLGGSWEGLGAPWGRLGAVLGTVLVQKSIKHKHRTTSLEVSTVADTARQRHWIMIKQTLP